MVRVQRLQAHVTLDDPEPTLARATKEAAAGDESWARWIEEYQRGEALIVRLVVTLEVSDGERDVVETANRGVFLEIDRHPANVEQQVAEVVSKDFAALARQLSARGHEVDRTDLDTMFVHVELGDDVWRSLAVVRTRADHPGGPEVEAGLSEHVDPRERK